MRDENFTGSELKGCDFSDADLTNANFFNAKMGVNNRRLILKIIISAGIAFILSVSSLHLSSFLPAYFYSVQLSLFGQDTADLSNILSWSYILSLFVYLSLKYSSWRVFGWFFALLLLVVISLALVETTNKIQKLDEHQITAELIFDELSTARSELNNLLDKYDDNELSPEIRNELIEQVNELPETSTQLYNRWNRLYELLNNNAEQYPQLEEDFNNLFNIFSSITDNWGLVSISFITTLDELELLINGKSNYYLAQIIYSFGDLSYFLIGTLLAGISGLIAGAMAGPAIGLGSNTAASVLSEDETETEEIEESTESESGAKWEGWKQATLIIIPFIMFHDSPPEWAMASVIILFGWYLFHRAIKYEEPMLSFIRRYALVWRCWGGTNFKNATLSQTDFSKADLAYVNFSKAKFYCPDFKGVDNLHLAFTFETPLQYKPIRELLMYEKITNQRDFSGYDLCGLSFEKLTLKKCIFYKTNLSETNLSKCDLSDADFSEAKVHDTKFNGAILTGISIDNWSVNKQTQFDDVECEFIFTKRNKKERKPAEGKYSPGDFSKIYQENNIIIDFIVSTNELHFFIKAINMIQHRGNDIQLQGFENKNHSLIVHVQCGDNVDVDAVYKEIQTLFNELSLQKSPSEKQYEETIQQLLDFIKDIKSNKVNITKINNDYSHHLENKNSPITNSSINFGDTTSIGDNYVNQSVGDELKEILRNLEKILSQINLAELDMSEETQHIINGLVEVNSKSGADREGVVKNTLAYLKKLQEKVSTIAEYVKPYSELSEIIEKLSNLFPA